MRVVISGDKSRYQFLRSMVEFEKSGNGEFLFTERLGVKEVFLTSDIREADENVFYSSRLPLNSELFFPPEYADLSDVYQDEDRVIWFDEFPYATDSAIEKLDDILQAGKAEQVSVVLFEGHRNTLDSDISTEDMALAGAEDRYKDKNISVYRYSVEESPHFLLWESGVKRKMLYEAYHAKLNIARFNLQIFDSDYAFMFESLDEQNSSISTRIDFDVLASFFIYDCSMKGKDVWKIYYDRSFRYYWENDNPIKSFCKMMYKSVIDDICLWDFDSDFNELYEEIKMDYENAFKIFTPFIFNGKKSEYNEFLNVKQEDILVFKMQIQKFFQSRMKEIIKGRIQRNIMKMEALLE